MDRSKLSFLALCAILASSTQAANYYADWSNGSTISIGGVTYRDLLDSNVWGVDPESPGTTDNPLIGSSANISLSRNATINAYFVSGTANASYNINLNGKTLTATRNGLRNMVSGTRFTVSNGSLKLKGLLWPDRSSDTDIKKNNVFMATGAGTTVDIGSLDFGSNLGSKPGAGFGNKVVVTNGAFMAAKVNLALYQNFSGEPNGFYVVGEGTVFSNKNGNGRLEIHANTGSGSFSNEFVIADGAVAQNLKSVEIGDVSTIQYGVGHLVAFRGPNTSHAFTGTGSMVGQTQRFEVDDGASVSFSSVLGNYGGIMTVKNGGILTLNSFSQYGDVVISGAGSKIVNTQNIAMKEILTPPRLLVKDGGLLSMETSNIQIGAQGGTNANMYVTGGGTVVCQDIILGLAKTNATYTHAPYDCRLLVTGEGSTVTFRSLTVGTADAVGTTYAVGCCTNGHDNVVYVTEGGQMSGSGFANIGFTCSSNALVVTSGGRFSCSELNIGRSRTGPVGTYKAEQVATDNRCVVADGTIEAATFSLRGIRTTCHATNGVVHATSTNSIDDVTAYLQIAGTNSLFKGDMAFHVKCTGGRIDFVLPRDGYARAPIQSDGNVLINASTELVLRPPAEAGNTAKAYILMQVPASGLLGVPDNALAGLRSSLATLAAEDPRFADYYVKMALEGGCRRLLVKRHDGTLVIFK